MKQISKLLILAMGTIGLLASCDKKADLPLYKNGAPVALTASVATVAAPPADSTKTVLSFTWTSPNYATEETGYKYILQIDTAGGDFSKPYAKVLTGLTSADLSTSFTAKELNNILLGYGFQFGVSYDMVARVVSSYGNNNEQLISNSVPIKMTPYKIPPKIAVPDNLIIVGDATIGAWDNPAKPASQAIAQTFSKLDETTYGGIFYLKGGAQYLMLPLSGNWDHKFGGASKTGGDLLMDGAVPGSNTPAPDADGWYKIVVDFQTGKYAVTAADPAPDNLYAIGDATPAQPQWDNAAVGAQNFTRLNSVDYELTIALEAGKSVKFISTLGQWQPQFGKAKGGADGDLGANYGGGDDPDTIVPAESGNYKISIDILTKKYTLTKQ